MMIKRIAPYALAMSLGLTCHAQAQPAPAAVSGSSDAPAAPGAQGAETPSTPPVEAPPTSAASPPAAGEEKGRIIFFRPSRLSGAIYTYHIVEVGDDGKPAKGAPHLGDLRNGGAFSYDAEPGIHSYNITGPMAINKDEDRLRLEIEPGQTYYVEQTIRMGLVTGGFRLVPVDEARFQSTKIKLAADK